MLEKVKEDQVVWLGYAGDDLICVCNSFYASWMHLTNGDGSWIAAPGWNESIDGKCYHWTDNDGHEIAKYHVWDEPL